MSTLVLTAARTAGQTLIATGKRYAKSYVKRRIREAFDGRTYEGPRLENFHILNSQEGAPMARVYGRARLAGQVIWAARLKENVTKDRVGGKGGPRQKTFNYTLSFAIGLCEGEILGVERLWVNGTHMSLSGMNIRIYNGTEAQLPDPIITAIEGENAPAFRGTAYMVFEDFPLDDFGARLPQFNAEVLRVPATVWMEPRLEDLVQGVNLIPGSGEFAYASDIVEDMSGQAVPVNMNNFSGQADIDRSLDQLETQLPNCKSVSLIVSWFGTDLRAGECEIWPGVESRDRLVSGAAWRVCGTTRETARLVSQDENGRAQYGGTPTDMSILQAIAALKSRGYAVSLYPFILMDVPPGNGLSDPHGGAEQAAFPWRGRITSAFDGSATAADDIAAFFGTCEPSDFSADGQDIIYGGADELSYRRFILHYAKLAALAGGVDRFVIGSEMRGLTTSRSEEGVYPAVSALKTLAADVRTILGAGTALTYAADWSEYFGHHDGADVSFHLDPLWSDNNIDAVGIDAYFPLADWRDGEHLDRAAYETIYDADYLASNMEGGEGYDWFYASSEDREAQLRSPITDGAAGKPWVFRYKDIRSWWGQPHYNRSGGAETAMPTDWVPKSKPIWFTEIGCPAIDKGANQPNVFVDPKSSESFTPYFSSGTRDDLIQRRYVETFLNYWSENNEISPIYGEAMVDMDAAHLWCWDARPFPDFPARLDIWSDGLNWQLGHWLSGRTGLIPLRDIVPEIALAAGVEIIDVSRVQGLIDGYVLDRPMSARAALEPLMDLYGISLMETASGLRLLSEGTEARITLSLDDIVDDTPGPLTEFRPDLGKQPMDVRVYFIDRARDFQVGMVSAQDRLEETVFALDIRAPVVMCGAQAKGLAGRLLSQAQALQNTIEFSLSPARLDVEAGDIVELPGLEGGWTVEAIERDERQKVSARAVSILNATHVSGYEPGPLPAVPWAGKPVVTILDIPDMNEDGGRQGVLVGVQASPFNPIIVLGPDGEVTLTVPAAVGTLISELPSGPRGRWDHSAVCEVFIPDVDLAAVDDEALLAGANRFAVDTELGWEIFQARDIELIDISTYRFRGMLRGLVGTDADMMESASLGARVAYLNQGFVDLPVSPSRAGDEIEIYGEGAGRKSDVSKFIYQSRHLRPLSPVHGITEISDDGLCVSWIRRSRLGGNSWAGLDVPLGEDAELYRVDFLMGENVIASFDVNTPSLFLSSLELSELGAFESILIRQGSAAYGYGPALRL